MTDYIQQLGMIAERGIEINMLSATQFSVGGFYKSGTVEVDIEKETITSRYDEISEFNNDLKQSLTKLNYDWWNRSKDRYDGWSNPDSSWEPLLLEYGFISKSEKIVVEYK